MMHFSGVAYDLLPSTTIASSIDPIILFLPLRSPNRSFYIYHPHPPVDEFPGRKLIFHVLPLRKYQHQITIPAKDDAMGNDVAAVRV